MTPLCVRYISDELDVRKKRLIRDKVGSVMFLTFYWWLCSEQQTHCTRI